MAKKKLLLILDMDGTVIEDRGYLGRNRSWRNEVRLRYDVIGLVSMLQEKYDATKIVITNQSGVARGYFDSKRVEEINVHIDALLRQNSIRIDNWQYCPDVDADYAGLNKDIRFTKNHIMKTTRRKPGISMVRDGLKELGKKLGDFDEVIVIGDKKTDDGKLAENIGAKFVNVSLSPAAWKIK